MTNHDRLLHFLYDSKHVRRDCLTDLRGKQLSLYMVTYDNEKLIYHGNGGEQATLYVFTLKGRFKYSVTVEIPGAASTRKKSRKSPSFSERFPGLGHKPEQPTLDVGNPEAPHILDSRISYFPDSPGSVPSDGDDPGDG